MSGLLGDGWGDPASMANLALAGGLLSPGSFGQGLSKGIAGYQGTLANSQDMQLKQQQIAAAIQEQKIKDIALAQQTRMFDLQTPAMELAAQRIKARLQPQGVPPAPDPTSTGQPAPMSQSVMFAPGMNAQRAGLQQTPGAGVPPSTGAAPSQQGGGGSLYPGVSDDVALSMIGGGGWAKIPETIAKYNEPGDVQKVLNALGIDPQSPQGQQYLKASLAKANYIAPLNVRPGGTVFDATKNQPVFAAPDSRGTQVSYGPTGASMALISGAADAEAAAARAKASGEGSVLPYAGVDATGRPLPVTNRTAVATQGPAPAVLQPQGGPPTLSTSGTVVSTPAAIQGLKDALPMKIKERDSMPPGDAKDAASREINRDQNAILTGKPWSSTTTASAAAPAGGAVYAAPPMGAETTAVASAKDAVENYNGLHTFATTSAPRNIGLLQTIQQLADKTLVGPGASKLQFINGVLNTVGITPGADQAQNYQIMKKNLNMLVGSQRMGAGGGGTDALQSLLEASNPNVAEMNGPAAKEAAEELIAYNRMMMAKDKAMPNPLSVPTQQYQAAESSFAPFSDPRLWQVEHAQSDAERARIISLMPASERASFLQKAAQARNLGVLN